MAGVNEVIVIPERVRDYQQKAQGAFDSTRAELQNLADSCYQVNYQGPNAKIFKERCGDMAVELANAVAADMSSIADAIRQATTNIAQALGGNPVVISVNTTAFQSQKVAAVDYVKVDKSALSGLTGTVNSHFSKISEQFSSHMAAMTALGQDGWQSNSQVRLQGEVQKFTSAATEKCNEAKSNIDKFIQEQLAAVEAADR